MTLILSGDITLRRTWQPMDPDAAAYITAVESADGQALEEKVKIAIDNFVLGCKADGIWDAIKASCILAGARTLNGALVPLAGTAPTNYNFVAGDYNRKTGLVGDGSTKYLDSNRNNNADPQNSKHMAAYATIAGATNSPYIANTTAGTGRSFITNTVQVTINRSALTVVDSLIAPSFLGANRSSASSLDVRVNKITTFITAVDSETPSNSAIEIFRRVYAGDTYANARLAFYSIGEALDLAKLDARVTDLINKFAEVIP